MLNDDTALLTVTFPVAEKPSRITAAHWNPGVAAWFFLDASLAFLAMYSAYAFSPYYYVVTHTGQVPHFGQWGASILFGLLTAATSQVFGLHNPLQPRQAWPTLIRCLASAWLSVGALALVVFAVFYSRIGRYMLFQAAGYTPILMAATRAFVWRRSEQRRQRILLLGAGRTGQQVKALIRRSGLPFDVVAFVDHNPELAGHALDGNAILGSQLALKEHCLDLQIDEVVACIGRKISEEAMVQLMECLSLGVRVSDYARFVERNFLQVPVENIRGEWFLQADLELTHPFYLGVKRVVDLAAGLVGLALSSPLLALAALAIKLESRGPIFYSQTRTGLHNRPFKIWKLRTMRADAEKDGPRWAGGKDDRVTRVGRILRRSRLDEVPQFWNILRGDMSLVGPRPERPEFVEKLSREIPFYNQRHLVNPGLTGWAQINYPYGASTEDSIHKLKFDLYYIKYASLGLDLQTILRTVGAMMKGAR
jgi:exopolysaccharide biosynthesis polyprenyl glycosylphosphotransferase